MEQNYTYTQKKYLFSCVGCHLLCSLVIQVQFINLLHLEKLCDRCRFQF
jgi:hypothetical protein